MKVIHLVTEDLHGAGRAAKRISRALNQYMHSEVYSLFWSGKEGSIPFALNTYEKKMGILLRKANNGIVKLHQGKGYFHYDKFGLGYHFLRESDADIVHLHWVNNGIWSDTLAKLLEEMKRPVVWTMHDMWPFTGGCHYDNYCGGYINGCKECKLINCNGIGNLSFKAAEKKKNQFKKMNIQLVGCSRWIRDAANSSYVGSELNHKCVSIPNPIDSDIFRIYDKQNCLERFKIKSNKKIILFGALDATSDERKGFKSLMSALSNINSEEYMLMVFGADHAEQLYGGKCEIKSLGYIKDDRELAMIYNMADVFVAPSLQENLANTVMESLACGTPVVAFDIGGMRDMITHRVSGFLVTPFDSLELAQGIEFAVTLKNRYEISEETKEKFSEDNVAKQYMEVYKMLLNNS